MHIWLSYILNMNSTNGTNANNSDSSAPMPESGWELFLKLVWKIICYFSPPWWLTVLVLIYAFGSVYAYFRHIKMKQACAGWRTTILLTRMALTGSRKGFKGIKRTFRALKNFVVFGIPGCVLFLLSGCLFIYAFLRNLFWKPEETGNGTWLSHEFVLSASTHGYLSRKDEHVLVAMQKVTKEVKPETDLESPEMLERQMELRRQNRRRVLDARAKQEQEKAGKGKQGIKAQVSCSDAISEIQPATTPAATGNSKKRSSRKSERHVGRDLLRELKKLKANFEAEQNALMQDLAMEDLPDESSSPEQASDSSSSSDSD